MCEGYQVTEPPPPHQDGQINRGGGQQSQSCARETERLGRTQTDRLTGAAQDAVSVGVERTDLLGGWGNITFGKNLDGQAHGTGAGYGVCWHRNNRSIGRMGENIYL